MTRMSNLPETGLLRLAQVLQFVPVSASTWWSGVKSGRFPKPRKLSKRVTVWSAKDIRELIDGLGYCEEGPMRSGTLLDENVRED